MAYNNTINSVGIYLGLLIGRKAVLRVIRDPLHPTCFHGRRETRTEEGGPQRFTEVPLFQTIC